MRSKFTTKQFMLRAGRGCSLAVLLTLFVLLSACQSDSAAVDTAQPDPSPVTSVQSREEPSESEVPTVPETPVQPPVSSPEADSAAQESEQPADTPVVEKAVLESYFDDSVFIGDSILEGIHQYVAMSRNTESTLGDAEFLTSIVGVSAGKLLREAEFDIPFYRYNGNSQPLLEILPQLECKRIFLLLGLNDLADLDPVVENIVADYSRLIDVLREAVPGVEVIVITSPPKVASTWLPDYTPNRNFNNDLIAEFVDAMTRMCNDRGIPYVDANGVLSDESGVLPDAYCSDGFVHLNSAGAAVVVEELYRFAAEQF